MVERILELSAEHIVWMKSFPVNANGSFIDCNVSFGAESGHNLFTCAMLVLSSRPLVLENVRLKRWLETGAGDGMRDGALWSLLVEHLRTRIGQVVSCNGVVYSL
jgi:hypothetical protein